MSPSATALVELERDAVGNSSYQAFSATADEATTERLNDAIACPGENVAPQRQESRNLGEPHETGHLLNGSKPKLEGTKAVIVSLQLALTMCVNSFTTGLMTIGIVDITQDLRVPSGLIYWPVLAYNLTSSPLLVPCGALADCFGARPVNLIGSFAGGAFMIGCGLSQNTSELIAFRCLQGAASALSLPTAMGVMSTALAAGKLRNIALACLSLSMITGFGLGLVLGGVFLNSVGWRFGFFLSGGAQIFFFFIGIFTVPSIPTFFPEMSTRNKIRRGLDWVGALISFACVGMISYVLAMVAENTASIAQPANICVLIASILMIPLFVLWMHHQTKSGRPALIPNSLWKSDFTSVCIVVAFANAEMQCMELLVSLFLQNIQSLSPLQSSLRILPGLISAAAINLVVGNIVHKVKVSWTLAGSAVVTGAAPLLMALAKPELPYWYQVFPAQIMYPICIDFVYVISALVISDAFPERDQALAGAVFNTVANLGQSLGLALIAIVTKSVTRSSGDSSAAGLLGGYRAGFWTAFASMPATAIFALCGLRKMRFVGVKRD